MTAGTGWRGVQGHRDGGRVDAGRRAAGNGVVELVQLSGWESGGGGGKTKDPKWTVAWHGMASYVLSVMVRLCGGR